MGFEKGKSVMKPQADNAFSEWTLRLYPVSLFFDDKFRNTGIKINYLKYTAVLLTSSSLLVLCYAKLRPTLLEVQASQWTVAHQWTLSIGFWGKNIGVGCHFLLQGIFQAQGLNLYILYVLYLLVGRFFTTAPPGNSISSFLQIHSRHYNNKEKGKEQD